MRIALLAPIVLALSSQSASAQNCPFAIDSGASSFSWSGTTSLGPINASPSTFSASGSLDVELATAGSNSSSTGKITGGLVSIPNLNGSIPNPLPFLPPLANVDITGLTLSPSSDIFHAAAGTGAFSTDVTMVALSGSAVVDAIDGSMSTLDLTGVAFDPVLVNGTSIESAGIVTISIPINSTVPIDDPDSGITGSVTIAGTFVATHDLASPCGSSMFEQTSGLSLALGGTQNFEIDLGQAFPSNIYWIFGSVTGTSPGIDFGGGVILPLNFDAYFNLTLNKPFLGVFGSYIGVTDTDGRASASLTIPPATDPSLVGLTLFHAATASAVFGTIDAATNAVSGTLVP